MKWCALILLGALLLTAAIPPTLVVSLDQDTHAVLATLDVCHSASPAISSNGDMPCVHELSLIPEHIVPFQLAQVDTPLFPDSLFVVSTERPPRS